ncbi:MAG: flagellar basal-body MS-ring/collar protein FliF [Methylophilaceae bacterium]|nr:flagellar basal-body MS-ring/collar protein FliF [Methylophilaceae bacterium]
MAEATGQSLTALIHGFNNLPAGRKVSLMVALAAIVAVIVGSWIWIQTPDYRILYSNLSDRDGGAVIESLQKLNIPYKMAEGGGAILVPSNLVYEARLKLASQGLPKGGAVGFDLMDNMKIGATQFQENVAYQRALEGEITRTIEAISAVQGARVHLAIPKETVFVREQQKPSASILINLYPGRALEKAQISGIVHLVASSVPDMPASNVTIIDQNGNLLTSPARQNVTGLDSSQLEYRQEVEQAYIRRIEDILGAITGPRNVKVQVSAELDFAVVEQTAETYKPNPTAETAAVRSSQITETTGDGGMGAAGVPGALSNQPPGAATAPLNAPTGRAGTTVATTGVTGGSMHKEVTTNYELDRTISHVRNPVGSIKRLSVAVVVNHKADKDKKGKVTYRALTKEELTQLYNLAREAMGFNQARGDTLNVVNAPFSVHEEEPAAAQPIWKDPSMVAMAKDILKFLVIAGILWYLVAGVVRPALSELAEAAGAHQVVLGTHGEAMKEGSVGEADVVMIGGSKRHSYEEDMQMVRETARQDPKIVANVVKDWVSR